MSAGDQLVHAHYVAEVKPGMLPIAINELDRQGFETMSPKVYERRPVVERGRRAPWLPKLKQRAADVEVPMFPGYLIVGFDTEVDPWERINATRGVQELIKGVGADLPARLPWAFVQELRHRCKAGPVRDTSWLDGFRPKRSVKILEGPLEGLLGTVDRVDAQRERVWVLMSFFGTPRALEFEGAALEAM